MPKIELIQGDCLEKMKDIPDDVFIFSDPPYNQGYHYNLYHDRMGKDEYANMLRKVFGDRKSAIIHYPEEIIQIMGGGLFDLQQVVSWVYPSNTAKQHRLIAWFCCKPDMRKIPQPYKNPTDKRIAKRIAEGKMARSYDWWEINQVKNVSKKDNPHPCPVPLQLMEKIILSTTQEGDVVCDPFMGSGTTGIACKNLNRSFIGIELDPEYFKIAEKRINEISVEDMQKIMDVNEKLVKEVKDKHSKF
jgi:site-specific DNA-methyltransferase (adenine-specific)